MIRSAAASTTAEPIVPKRADTQVWAATRTNTIASPTKTRPIAARAPLTAVSRTRRFSFPSWRPLIAAKFSMRIFG